VRKIILVILSIVIISFWSCQKDKVNISEYNFKNIYFPIHIGSWISYQIESINIDTQIDVNDTVSYQIKELIESELQNFTNFNTYRVERYYRKDSTEEWEILNVWELREYDKRIHKIEENVEYIRLLTPVKLHQNWDGNLYNYQEQENCELRKIEFTNIGQKMSETAFVTHYDFSSLIDKHFSEEQYAKNIGLVNKTIIDVDLNIDPNTPWENKITKGEIYYQTYLDSYE